MIAAAAGTGWIPLFERMARTRLTIPMATTYINMVQSPSVSSFQRKLNSKVYKWKRLACTAGPHKMSSVTSTVCSTARKRKGLKRSGDTQKAVPSFTSVTRGANKSICTMMKAMVFTGFCGSTPRAQ